MTRVGPWVAGAFWTAHLRRALWGPPSRRRVVITAVAGAGAPPWSRRASWPRAPARTFRGPASQGRLEGAGRGRVTGSGERVVVIGDSWSAGLGLDRPVQSWPSRLPGRVRVAGFSGSGFSAKASPCGGVSFADRAPAALRGGADLVVIEGGLNDYDRSRAEIQAGLARVVRAAARPTASSWSARRLAPVRARAVPRMDRLLPFRTSGTAWRTSRPPTSTCPTSTTVCTSPRPATAPSGTTWPSGSPPPPPPPPCAPPPPPPPSPPPPPPPPPPPSPPPPSPPPPPPLSLPSSSLPPLLLSPLLSPLSLLSLLLPLLSPLSLPLLSSPFPSPSLPSSLSLPLAPLPSLPPLPSSPPLPPPPLSSPLLPASPSPPLSPSLPPSPPTLPLLPSPPPPPSLSPPSPLSLSPSPCASPLSPPPLPPPPLWRLRSARFRPAA